MLTAIWLFLLMSFKSEATDLQLLILQPFVNDTAIYPECMAAIDYVLEAANRNNQILPGYNLIKQINNEGQAAIETNKAVINFLQSNDHKYMAPAIIGPFYACHIAGRLIKALHFVQFSPLCHGKYIVENKNKFALFSAQGSGKSKFIMERFLQVHWKEYGVLTHKENRNAEVFAEDLMKLATERSNLKQVFYASDESDVSDQTMLALKKSKARVIVLTHGVPEVCLQFFCKAYHLGIKPPRYFFIVDFFSCLLLDVKDEQLPENCTREQLDFQKSAAIAVDVLAKAVDLDENSTSPLEYTFNEMDQIVDFSNLPMAKQHNYMTCHDAATTAVMTLHEADKELRRSFNLSLLNFQSNASLVQNVMNQSALNLRFNSFRVGVFEFDPDTGYILEDLFLAQPSDDGKNVKLVYRLPVHDHGVNASLDTVNPMKWPTPNGKPPKDLSNVQVSYRQCYFALDFVIFPLMSIFVTILQLVVFSVAIHKASRPRSKENISFKATLTIGCFFLNIGAIWHIVGREVFPQLECLTTPVFPCLGVGLTTSTLFLMTFSIHSKPSVRPRKSKRNVSFHDGQVACPMNNSMPFIVFRSFIQILLLCCFLSLWIGLQPF